MNAYEHFAIGEYLGEIPENKTFGEVMQMLLDGDEDVYVCEVYEYLPRRDVVDMIECLCEALEKRFIPREEVKQ
jgi:hypothetical protein